MIRERTLRLGPPPPDWLLGIRGHWRCPRRDAFVRCVLLWQEGQHTGAVRYRWNCHGRQGVADTLDGALAECCWLI